MNIHDYTQMEGLGLRIIPVRTPSQQEFYIYGSGRVEMDKVHERVTKKWRWGNFDKKRLYVDNSYGASLQAHKMVMWRSAARMVESGRMQQAIETTDAFFTGFPNMNFPYDARVLPHINIYIKAGAMDKAKYHMRILANELADNMEFFDSLDDDDLQSGFNLDWRLSSNAISEILKVSKTMKDDAFAQEMESILGPYAVTVPMQENQ
jgi:hypothetical protein